LSRLPGLSYNLWLESDQRGSFPITLSQGRLELDEFTFQETADYNRREKLDHFLG